MRITAVAFAGCTLATGACISSSNPTGGEQDAGSVFLEDGALPTIDVNAFDVTGLDVTSFLDAGRRDTGSPLDAGSASDASGGGDASDAAPTLDATDSAPGVDANDAAPVLDASDAGFDATLPFPIVLESPGAGGAVPNGTSYFQNGVSAPCISTTGQYVAFMSNATNLAGEVSGPAVGYTFFLRDTAAGTTTEVSVLPDGGDLAWPYPQPAFAVSGDGRYVVYMILASSWSAAYPTNTPTFLRWDRTTGQTTLIGVTGDGGTLYGGNNLALSSDGRYLAFFGGGTLEPLGTNAGTYQVWVRDLAASGDGLTLASVTDGPLDAGPDAGDAALGAPASQAPSSSGNTNGGLSMSSDGTVVAFATDSANLIAPSVDAGVASSDHCFVRNLTTQKTELVDVQVAGAAVHYPNGACEQPLVSGDGHHVVFYSEADNLVAGDTNGVGDIFLRDLTKGTTTRLTTAADGSQLATLAVLNPDYGISSDGSIVVLGDRSHKMVVGEDAAMANRVVVVLDLVHATRKIASYKADGSPLQSGQDTWTPGVSGDGTFIAYLGSGGPFFANVQDYVEQVIGVKTAAAR